MKIAAITVFCNEDIRLKYWVDYANQYINSIHLHIIINNGEEEYSRILEANFPSSIILHSSSKSLTKAYNLGIKFALKDILVDSVLLIANDIKISSESILKLHHFLNSNPKLGMVAPVILQKDSNDVETYGANINELTYKFNHLYKGTILSDLKSNIQITDGVPGGMNLAKREYYENIGLQDEKLIMYADEIDMGIRAKKFKYIMAATSDSIAWHQHIDRSANQIRPPLSGFLISRNSIYLAYKHTTIIYVLTTFFSWFYEAVKINLGAHLKNKSIDHKTYCYYFLLGTIYGLLKVARLPKRFANLSL